MRISTKIVLEALDRWPNTPNLTLAKKLCKDNPKAFNSVEHARSMIRQYKGRMGDKSRKEVKNRKHFDKNPINFNPFNLPDSDAEDDTVFNIPKQYNHLGIFADIHVPYHDVEALTVAMQHCKNIGCNAILLDGDAIDFYTLSRFDKDPRARDVGYELDALASIIRTLNDEFGKVFYKIGNHEERYEKYLRVKAPELLNVAEYQFANLMIQRGAKCEVIYHNKIMAGKLPIVHGHEFQSKTTSPVNPARGLFMKGHTHGMVAHSHRTSQHTDKDLTGKMITSWSVGCLCGLHPEYARINNWNHGFADVKIGKDDSFDFNNYRIYKGQVWR